MKPQKHKLKPPATRNRSRAAGSGWKLPWEAAILLGLVCLLCSGGPLQAQSPAYLEARQKYERQEYLAAMLPARQAVEEDGGNAAYRHLYGAILLKLKQYSEAEEHLRQAVALDPYNTLYESTLKELTAARKRAERGIRSLVGETDEREQVTLWWEDLPEDVRTHSRATGSASNIHPGDYVGPETCKGCHEAEYQSWFRHAHRRMNALADDSTVEGDFSGKARVSYLGGEAVFFKEGGRYKMRLQRGDVRRVYQVNQTIGSRFFQYYIGKQTEGPEPRDHLFYRQDHVLFFGYWLEQRQWVPIVHVGPELPDGERPDPFDPPTSQPFLARYSSRCNFCHTTFPLGDMLARNPSRMARHVPVPLHFSLGHYLDQNQPGIVDFLQSPAEASDQDILQVRQELVKLEAPQYAATLGVSCEACHLGGREHVATGGKEPPGFFPSSPFLFVDAREKDVSFGRTHDNLNWACGRCHVGTRPTYANGISTWNSTEYSDAVQGSCFSQLRCIDCHNPHETIGPRWSRPPDEDDRLCLRCHQQLEPAQARRDHTRHPAGSSGARCMNCHRPRINEGIQDLVRTHTIFSPTDKAMIEANHPNACNMCHTDRTIDWTVGYLKEWYGAGYSEEKLAENYPDRERSVALGWLQSESPAVRLVGADVLSRTGAGWALPELIGVLDDPYLINRQFTRRWLDRMLEVRLQDFGYRFYMTPEERRGPIAGIRAELWHRKRAVAHGGSSPKPSR
jgi:predicted CXXCH cytochrome family protein